MRKPPPDTKCSNAAASASSPGLPGKCQANRCGGVASAAPEYLLGVYVQSARSQRLADRANDQAAGDPLGDQAIEDRS